MSSNIRMNYEKKPRGRRRTKSIINQIIKEIIELFDKVNHQKQLKKYFESSDKILSIDKVLDNNIVQKYKCSDIVKALKKLDYFEFDNLLITKIKETKIHYVLQNDMTTLVMEGLCCSVDRKWFEDIFTDYVNVSHIQIIKKNTCIYSFISFPSTVNFEMVLKSFDYDPQCQYNHIINIINKIQIRHLKLFNKPINEEISNNLTNFLNRILQNVNEYKFNTQPFDINESIKMASKKLGSRVPKCHCSHKISPMNSKNLKIIPKQIWMILKYLFRIWRNFEKTHNLNTNNSM